MEVGFLLNSLSIIIGNICSLLAMASDSFSSTRKSAKGVLLVQCLSQFIYGVGTVILKGYSGAVQNAVSIIRNFVAIKEVKSKAVEWILVLLGVGLGVAFNNLGLIGYLPILANLQYTLAVFKFKDNDRALKISFAVCVALFAAFNIAILNFVGFVSNLVVLVTTIVMIFKGKKNGESV